MATSTKKNTHTKQDRDVQVPRDRKLDDGSTPPTRSPDGPSMRDEDYTDRDKPLVGGSDLARRLHEHPPKGRGQLGVGTAGDAARPSSSGIYSKPIPPRGGDRRSERL